MTIKNWKWVGAMLVIGLAAVTLSEAGHKHEPVKTESLLNLAFEVEDGARQLSRHAERTMHHGSYRERRALVRLEWLADEARDFRRALERYGPGSPRSEREFSELREAFRRSGWTIGDLHAIREVERDFLRLDRRMDDLTTRYQMRNAHNSRYDREAYPTRDPRRDGKVSVGISWNR